MKTKRVVISMKPSDLDQLDALANIEYQNRSEMIRSAFKYMIDNKYPHMSDSRGMDPK